MGTSLQKNWLEKKLVEPDSIGPHVAKLRSQGNSIATLNGSFDLLHAGHLYMIHQASLQADILFVLLNTDASIKRYKGVSRPLISLQHRLEMMAALEFVDFITWFEEDDPRNILKRIRPDVHVNGKEYGKDCIEAKTVLSFEGKLHLVDRIPSLSTTSIIDKIKRVPTS